MNSCDYKEQLELGFGESPWPPGLKKHLKECADCRAYADELSRLGNGLDVADEQMAAFVDADMFVAGVEARLSNTQSLLTGSRRWYRYVAAAAVVVVALGSLTVGYWYGQDSKAAFVVKLTDGGSEVDLVADLLEGPLYTLDDITVELIVTDIAPANLYGLEERLLEELTDETLEYLEQNFDMGDLL